ncbi:hypothetical protein GCM10028824_25700 [Hymenobacter segetis]
MPVLSAAGDSAGGDFRTFSAGFFRTGSGTGIGAGMGLGEGASSITLELLVACDFRTNNHTPSAPMATPPSTAHTVVQCEAG